MYKNILAVVVVLVSILGCGENTNLSKTNSNESAQSGGPFKKIFSEGNYNFQIEYNDRLDTSYFDVLYNGEKVSRSGYKGKITQHYLTDLNKDRKNEVYLVVEQDSVAKVHGYWFDAGQSMVINKGARRKKENIKSSTINLERNQIIYRFTYLSDEGIKEYGETRYNLVKRDEDFVLLPQGWQSFEIDDLIGEYTTKEEKESQIYKVLLIGEREGGRWNVDIKVKRTRDKAILCHFSGLGEFVDKDLFVPLHQEKEALKGTLQIRFVDALAIVYTEKVDDFKEMSEFCNDKVSIAGNYKKIETDE